MANEFGWQCYLAQYQIKVKITKHHAKVYIMRRISGLYDGYNRYPVDYSRSIVAYYKYLY